jgi:predicted enzyme related to lactoylglutathione lyase
MFFVDEPKGVAQWWAALVDVPSDSVTHVDSFSFFEVDELEIGFHLADPERNPVGGSPVVYLRTEDLSKALARAESLGARRHRGPLTLESFRAIAQMVDPFGNFFGFDGPPSS